MLLALAVLGGSTIRWFAVALLVGTISGTYSSPFVAVPVLVTWEQSEKKFKKK
jgi:preprotein translocase subunit SecF